MAGDPSDPSDFHEATAGDGETSNTVVDVTASPLPEKVDLESLAR